VDVDSLTNNILSDDYVFAELPQGYPNLQYVMYDSDGQKRLLMYPQTTTWYWKNHLGKRVGRNIIEPTVEMGAHDTQFTEDSIVRVGPDEEYKKPVVESKHIDTSVLDPIEESTPSDKTLIKEITDAKWYGDEGIEVEANTMEKNGGMLIVNVIKENEKWRFGKSDPRMRDNDLGYFPDGTAYHMCALGTNDLSYHWYNGKKWNKLQDSEKNSKWVYRKNVDGTNIFNSDMLLYSAEWYIRFGTTPMYKERSVVAYLLVCVSTKKYDSFCLAGDTIICIGKNEYAKQNGKKWELIVSDDMIFYVKEPMERINLSQRELVRSILIPSVNGP
jgi:hypothetical protein